MRVYINYKSFYKIQTYFCQIKKVGIPYEIKDYSISGKISDKQCHPICESDEFCENQESYRNDHSIQTQNQQQANSIFQKDMKEQAFLGSLQSNLNSIKSKQNMQQLQSPQNRLTIEEQPELCRKITEEENEDQNQLQFDKYFKQNIQKQLQNIQQMKGYGDNSNQMHQKQVVNSQIILPKSEQQQNIQQNNIQKGNHGINNTPPSSKQSILQYQQYLSTFKQKSSSPSENQKSFEKQNTLQSKQSTPGNSYTGKYQLNNYMTKRKDIQEEYKSNYPIQQNLQSKNSLNATPSSNNSKINPNYNNQQYLQQNQYIPLSQQIQNQIANNRIQEDKQQQEIKQQNDKILQQQLIEQQKQKILKNFQEKIQKQQQKQTTLDQQQKNNNQNIISQNVIRQHYQSLHQQSQYAVSQNIPAKRNTTDDIYSNLNSKQILLKLENNSDNKYQNQEDANQDQLTYQSSDISNQIFSQNYLASKRLDTDGSAKYSESSQSQKQQSIGENNSKLPPNSKSGIIGIYQSLSNQQISNTVNQKLNEDNIYKQIPLNNGSSYQNQSSLQLIKKVLEQKDFKGLNISKDNNSNTDSRNSLHDPNKKERSIIKDNYVENIRQDEKISIGSSFQEDKKTEISIQSLSKSDINTMNLSNISKSGKMRISQESLMKSLEERKKYTIAANNQKCIIFTKDQNKEQNSSFTNQNSKKKNQFNLKMQNLISSAAHSQQEDPYFVHSSIESLQKQIINPFSQVMSGKQLQNYYNQQIYEEQIRQSQMLQQEDEEALQHQQYLREQDILQQQISLNDGIHSPHVYECTSQGYIKSNAMIDINAKQTVEPVKQEQQDINEVQIHKSNQNIIQSGQLQNSNHMTFGPNQKSNFKQQLLEQQVSQNNLIQQQNNQMNVVNVNQMLKQQQIQTNGQINIDSYQISNAQSPNNNRYQNQGNSMYSSIENLTQNKYLQQNLRGRIGSNMSNCINLNTSTDTVSTISKISNNTGINYRSQNGKLVNGQQQKVVVRPDDVNLSTNLNYQNLQNQSYASSYSNNRGNCSSKKDSSIENSQTNIQQINKKDLNWLNYSSFERNNIWMKLKQQNRQNLKQELNEKEQQECTFKPSLIASRKPGLTKQYTKTCSSQSNLLSYSSNKKNNIKDYSSIQRPQGMVNSGYYINGNLTTNTTTNNSMVQNSNTYQSTKVIKSNIQTTNNIPISKAIKPITNQNNVQIVQNTDQPYYFLSHVQSPTTLNNGKQKVVSYQQINQLKKSISSTPNLLHNIPQTSSNSSQNKGNGENKQIYYQQFKPNILN